jgi:hypothetical protein
MYDRTVARLRTRGEITSQFLSIIGFTSMINNESLLLHIFQQKDRSSPSATLTVAVVAAEATLDIPFTFCLFYCFTIQTGRG